MAQVSLSSNAQTGAARARQQIVTKPDKNDQHEGNQ
jgi:hypothetical protein